MNKMDIRASREENRYIETFVSVPENSVLARYLKWVASESRAESLPYELVKENSEQGAIAVIMRTQGKRMDALEEALLCLTAQTSRDFMVILLMHNADEEARERVSHLVENQPRWLKDRIELVAVDGGGRSRPLNVALSIVESPYAVILDDDDLVFDNWIESFLSELRDHYGSIILSGVYTQEWTSTEAGTSASLRAVSSPHATYTFEFDPFVQVSTNRCPTMAWAFPTFVCRDLGFRFDESLTTTEDWDYLMRISYVCGVTNSGCNTAIYRLWKDAENSHQLHDEGEWEMNRTRILDKMSDIPLLLPEGTSSLIEQRLSPKHSYVRIHSSQVSVHRVDETGAESAPLECACSYDPESRESSVSSHVGWEGEPTREVLLRFNTEGSMTLKNLKMRVELDDGSIREFDPSNLVYNGFWASEEETAFLESCSYVKVCFDEPASVVGVEVRFGYSRGVDDRLYRGTRLLVRARAKKRKLAWNRSRR